MPGRQLMGSPRSLTHPKWYTLPQQTLDHKKFSSVNFIRVPRTGTTALENTLYAMGVLAEDYNDTSKIRTWRSMKQAKEHCDDSAFFFATIRNPYTRALSGWKHVDSLSTRSFVDVLRNPPMVEGGLATWDSLNPEFRASTGEAFRHFTATQTEFLTDETGNIPSNLNLVRNETFQHDLSLILAQVGIELSEEVPNFNSTSNGKPKLSAEEIKLVNKHFVVDFINLRYELLSCCKRDGNFQTNCDCHQAWYTLVLQRNTK